MGALSTRLRGLHSEGLCDLAGYRGPTAGSGSQPRLLPRLKCQNGAFNAIPINDAGMMWIVLGRDRPVGSGLSGAM